MAPFTEPVITSLKFLRRAIEDVDRMDGELGNTLTAIVDDLIVNIEDQMLLCFSNWGVEESKQEHLFVKNKESAKVLETYFHTNIKNREKKRAELVGDTFGGDTAGSSSPTMQYSSMASPTPGGSQAVVKRLPPEVEAHRSLTTGLFLTLESIAYHVQAERAMLFLFHRTTSHLKVVASAPDHSVAQRGAFMASHQGVQGSVFTNNVAVRCDEIDAEMRRVYVQPADVQLDVNTHNTICFPICHPGTRQQIGVLECCNKTAGLRWSEADEAVMYHGALFLWYLLSSSDSIDFHDGTVFNPVAVHSVQPYQPSPYTSELEGMEGPMHSRPTHFIVRIQTVASMPAKTENFQPTGGKEGAGKEKDKTDALNAAREQIAQKIPSNAETITSLINVKELKGYLTTMEHNYRNLLNEFVKLKREASQSADDVQKKSQRVRLLEDNILYLTEQLQEAKQKEASQPPKGFEGNYGEFGVDGVGNSPLKALAGSRDPGSTAGGTNTGSFDANSSLGRRTSEQDGGQHGKRHRRSTVKDFGSDGHNILGALPAIMAGGNSRVSTKAFLLAAKNVISSVKTRVLDDEGPSKYYGGQSPSGGGGGAGKSKTPQPGKVAFDLGSGGRGAGGGKHSSKQLSTSDLVPRLGGGYSKGAGKGNR